jgi:hypothetical protein
VRTPIKHCARRSVRESRSPTRTMVASHLLRQVTCKVSSWLSPEFCFSGSTGALVPIESPASSVSGARGARAGRMVRRSRAAPTFHDPTHLDVCLKSQRFPNELRRSTAERQSEWVQERDPFSGVERSQKAPPHNEARHSEEDTRREESTSRVSPIGIEVAER